MSDPVGYARRLAAFLPTAIARRVDDGGALVPGDFERFEAAALFADLSGFTRLSADLAADGPRGAESVNRLLFDVFTPMVTTLQRAGGIISHFYGDAMLVIFPEETVDPVSRAYGASLEIQRLVRERFATVTADRPFGRPATFPLTIKIGLGYGACLAGVTGDEHQLEYVVVGPAVNAATAAEKSASAGEVRWGPRFGARLSARRAAGLQPVPHERAPGEFVPSAGRAARFVTIAAPFVPRAVRERALAGGGGLLGEHRPVTSMFVQFDGFDSADEPDIGARIQAYYAWACAMVRRFAPDNGHVNRVLTGDKGNQLHILFGAPVAPDTPEQAIRCALAMQQERPAFIKAQRIGLSTGNVFATTVGSPHRHEYTVIGYPVVRSARLCEHCPEGEVLCDMVTADRVQRTVEFEPLPSIALKGIEKPLPVARPVGFATSTAQLESRYAAFKRPLIGYEQARQQLQRQLDGAAREQGMVAAVVGPAGSGKSHLIATTVAHWLALGGRGFVAWCQAHAVDRAYEPWQEVGRAIFDVNYAESAERRRLALETRAAEYGLDEEDTALWAQLFGMQWTLPPALADLPAPDRRERLFRAVARAVSVLAERGPFLLIIEDLQWIDSASLDLLRFLVERSAAVPLAILVSMREPGRARDAAIPPEAVVGLEGWTPKQAAEFVCTALNVPRVPPALNPYLHLDEAYLNPLFLSETVDALLAARAIAVSDGMLGFDIARLEAQSVPVSTRALLLARFDRLPAAARAILQLAAVVGEQFYLETLLVLDEARPAAVVVDVVADLVEQQLLQIVVRDPKPVYAFASALFQEIVYDNLPFAVRRRLHGIVADYVSRRYADNLRPYHAILARHFGRAEQRAPALRYARAAGDDAMAVYAVDEAARLYTIALEHAAWQGETSSWTIEADLLRRRGIAYQHMGRFAAASEDLKRSSALARRHDDALRYAEALDALLDVQSREAAFQAMLEPAQALIRLGDRIPPRYQAMGQLSYGRAAGALGDTATAFDHFDKAEAICRAAGEERWLSLVLEAKAFIHFSNGDHEAALPLQRRSVELSRRYLPPYAVARNLNNVAMLQRMVGDFRGALASIEKAEALSAETSHNSHAGILTIKAGIAACLGRYALARDALEEAESILAGMDDEFKQVELYLQRAVEYAAALARWDEAAQYLGHAATLIAHAPARYTEEAVRLALGWALVHLGRGAAGAADEALDQAAGLIAQHDHGWWITTLCSLRGQACLLRGDRRGAVNHALDGLRRVKRANREPEAMLWLVVAQSAPTGAETLAALARALDAAQRRAPAAERDRCLRAAADWAAWH